jgi:hypothetical protein
MLAAASSSPSHEAAGAPRDALPVWRALLLATRRLRKRTTELNALRPVRDKLPGNSTNILVSDVVGDEFGVEPPPEGRRHTPLGGTFPVSR